MYSYVICLTRNQPVLGVVQFVLNYVSSGQQMMELKKILSMILLILTGKFSSSIVLIGTFIYYYSLLNPLGYVTFIAHFEFFVSFQGRRLRIKCFKPRSLALLFQTLPVHDSEISFISPKFQPPQYHISVRNFC